MHLIQDKMTLDKMSKNLISVLNDFILSNKDLF